MAAPPVFKQVTVTFAPEGGTRVVWVLSERFRDPLPHVYQLQVGESQAPGADDFEDVGLPAENTFFAVDGDRRRTGKALDIAYRVRLTTPGGTYYSNPASALQYLNRREWLHARDQIRQLKKLIRKYTGCYEGRLLKRKRFGPPCPTCLDPLTEQPQDSKCPDCFGTGYVAGYFAAVPDFNIELGLEQSREKVDQTTATGRSLVIRGTTAADVLVNSRDVFVAERSGRRWFIETVETLAEYRGYPTKYGLELRVAPFSDVIYRVPLEGS